MHPRERSPSSRVPVCACSCRCMCMSAGNGPASTGYSDICTRMLQSSKSQILCALVCFPSVFTLTPEPHPSGRRRVHVARWAAARRSFQKRCSCQRLPDHVQVSILFSLFLSRSFLMPIFLSSCVLLCLPVAFSTMSNPRTLFLAASRPLSFCPSFFGRSSVAACF